MSRGEMAAEFNDCAHATLSPERITAALEAIYGVEEMGSVGETVERVTFAK